MNSIYEIAGHVRNYVSAALIGVALGVLFAVVVVAGEVGLIRF